MDPKILTPEQEFLKEIAEKFTNHPQFGAASKKYLAFISPPEVVESSPISDSHKAVIATMTPAQKDAMIALLQSKA